MKIIEITIATDGNTTVATKGFSGSECQDASRFIEVALGKRTGQRLTADYYQSAGQTLKETEGR